MLQVDKDSFQAEVLDAQGFVLVDYFSDGCEPIGQGRRHLRSEIS